MKKSTFSFFLSFSLFSLLLISTIRVQAEGTKQIRPSSGDAGYLVLDASWSDFALYNCDATSRLNIRICNIGEKVYYGFRQTNNDVEYRIKDPDGNTIIGPATLPSSGNGRIDSYSEAVNGPKPVVGSSGYDALSFTATKTGDYYIEFKKPSSRRTFSYFDITVTTSGNVAIPGRIWSQAWMFSTDSYTNKFKGKLYIYSDDGIVTSLDFNDMQPYVFVVSANATGTQNTGNFTEDRKSQSGLSTYPQYKIFLNNPDENCFPTGAFGEVTDVDISGCGENKCINITSTSAGNVLLLLDLNGTPGYQPGTTDRQFATAVTAGVTCIPWDTKDGLGNEVPGGTNLPIQIDYLNGITHLPLYDVEYHTNGYEVALIRPADPDIPKLYWDDTDLPGGTSEFAGCNSPCHTWTWGGSDDKAVDYGNRNTVNTWWYAKVDLFSTTLPVSTAIVDADRNNPAGEPNDTTICTNQNTLQLAGSVTGFTTTGQWTSATGGSFSDNESMDAVYTFSAGEKVAGNVIKLALTSTNNGGCPAVSDTLTITFAPAPTAEAGPSENICKNNPTIPLQGSVTNATGGLWIGGNGTFVPNRTTLTATYTPTQAELDANGVTLTLETTGNGICPSSSNDQVIINYQASPTADAGDDQTICANNPEVTLEGEVSNHTSFAWVGGAGTFTPDRNTLNVTYTPTAAEISSGSVVLNLTSSRAGCNDVTDPVTITFTSSPTVTPGPDQTICKNDTIVNLNGSFTGATTAQWFGGLGTFTPDRNTMTAEYKPHPSETGGNVTLTLTTTDGLGNCNPVSEDLVLSFINAPVVGAGDDDTRCANNAEIQLGGSSSTGSGTWIGGGTFVPDANTLNAKYFPSNAEKTIGVAQLFLRSTNNGICNYVEDTLLIFLTAPPTADAGSSITVCANNPEATLNGAVTAASSFSWSGGNGVFDPSANALNAKYTPSASEISAGSVTLTLTANRATCISVTDEVTITITEAPTVSAGADRVVCANNPDVTLNGSFTVATGAEWIGGNGTFTPDRNSMNAVYTPTSDEIDNGNGSVTLTLSTTGNGSCSAVTEDMTITFTPAPTVDAGTPQTVCANNSVVTLAGVSSTGVGTWSGGTGTFSPNNNTLNATYTPAAGETSVTLTLTTGDNGNCNSVSDQMDITVTAAPTVNPGNPITVCADDPEITLNGSVTVAAGGVWTGGNGTFSPDRNTLTATYTPSATEISNGTVQFTLTSTDNNNCNAVSGDVTLTINPAPTIEAGQNQTVCGAVASVNLEAEVTVATGGTWTTSGTGTFSNANALVTTYTPSADDKTAGVVTLTVTSTGNGLCQAVSDQVKIFFTSVPSIFAGPDQKVCTNEYPIQLAATGSPATWSGFGGTISNPNDLGATYTPSAAEELAGEVTLTITTTPSGACPSISDEVKITINPKPVPDAGAPQTVCGSLASIPLTGSEPEYGTGFWTTTGAGSFSPNATTLNASYVPTADERENGAVVTNILTSTPNGVDLPCPAEDDSMTITIAPEIVVFAGPDQTFCADVTTINLSGTVQTASGGTWSIVSGNGSIADPNSLITTYTVAPADTTAGSVTLRLTSDATANCAAVSSDVTFTFTPAPEVNAGAPLTMCSDEASINLSGSVTVATGGQWTTTGSGSFSPDAATLNTTYFPSAADTTAGTVTFTLTTTGNGTCNAVSADVVLTINPKPFVEAGDAITVCKDVTDINLNGVADNVTGQAWTTFGDGTFDNDALLNAVYTPSAQDKNDGTVTLKLTGTGIGTCSPAEDIVVVTFTDIPTVDAGPSRTICADAAGVALNPTITIATGGTWTTSGSGTFDPDANTLTATYIPSDADTTAGTVTLTLETTGNGTCQAYQDDLVLTIDPKPIVAAGNNQTICADSAYVVLDGKVLNALGGEWTTSGSGNFFPNKNTLNAKYVPSVADKNSGSVTLTLTSTGNGTCNPVSSQVIITITPGPSANAGDDQEICASATSVNLSGSVNIVSTGIWTTSGTGTFSDPTDLNAVYTPSQNDKNAGGVILTLATTNNGNCKAATEQMQLVIKPLPIANLGANKSICADATQVQLNGTVTNATGGEWTTSGTGVFGPNASTLNAIYHPSDADKLAGSVTLTLTTTGNGVCDAVSQAITLTITPAPTVEAGNSQTICADASSVSLNGSKTVASGGVWTSSGSGTFSPDPTTLNASYLPSGTDKTNGSVTLTLTTTGNGTCIAVKDTVKITITPAPTANAGDNQTVCVDQEFITLSGSVTQATGGTWTTSGTGEFIPDATALNAQYFPSEADKDDGDVTLTLTTTGMGTCNAVSSNMTIDFTPEPTINAGPNISVCNLVNDIELNPTVSTNAGVWETTGTGTFDDENNLNATYFPSAADKTGSIMLILLSNNNGACDTKKDTVLVTFTASPSVSAGDDKSVCKTDAVELEASGTTGTWSGGLGSFSPNANTLNATYIPDASEIGGAPVVLTFTPTPIPGCPLPSDDVEITITNDGPTVDAGLPIQACANTTGVTLAGTFGGTATGIKWSTGSGTGTFSSETDPNATFTPSPQQIAAGVANLTLTTTGNGSCKAQSDKVVITITPAPTVSGGANQNVCATATTVNLSATKTVATGVSWATIPGQSSGSFDDNLSETPVYTIHADDRTRGFATLRVTTTGNGVNCEAVQSDVTITFAGKPAATAGADTDHCADVASVALNGSVSDAAGGEWSTSGTGTFSPSVFDLNATYIPSADDRTGFVDLTLTTTGNGACAAETSVRRLTFTPPPVIAAGDDQQFCSDEVSVALTGSFSDAGGIQWTTSGTGTFSSDTDPVATYSPSAQDKINGGVNLTITTTGSAPCAEVEDYVTLMILPAPTSVVNAGFDQELCRDVTSVELNGQITIAGGGKWSTLGDGTFFPNDSTLNAEYIPTDNDRNNGFVDLILTSTGNGICNAADDTMRVTFTPSTIADAGTPATPVCTDVTSIALDGDVQFATGGKWSTTGSGTFSPNEFDLDAVYFFSEADFTNGSIGFTLTTTGNGTCNANSSNATVTFTKKPVVNAGTDKVVCSDVVSIPVSASITNATGGTWTTSGTGVFGNANLRNTIYTPSADDIASTKVNLTFTANAGIGTCNPVSDQMTIDFTPAPTVEAGPAQTICADATGLTINGTVTVATGGLWTTSGSGQFVPNANSLSATYQPSEADKTTGSVTLTLTTTGNGTCNPVNDTKDITIVPIPVVDAGPAFSCSDLDGAILDGDVQNAGGGFWTSSGTGTFAISPATLDATYFPSEADLTTGNITLTLTSTANGTCMPVSESATLLVKPLPIANAGGNQYVCVGSDITLIAEQSDNVRYQWTDNAPAVIGNTESVTLTVPADMFVVLSVTDADGCVTRDTVRLNVYDLPTLNLPDHACLSDSLVLDAQPVFTVPTVPGQFQWFRGTSILPGETGYVLPVKNTGAHIITWSYGACSTSDTSMVTEPPFLLSVDTIVACEGGTATLTTVSTPATGITYAWTTGGTPAGNTQTITATPAAGISTYYVQATDALGCFVIDSIKLNGIPTPAFNISDSVSCQGETIELNGSVTNIPGYLTMNPVWQWKQDNTILPDTDSLLSVNTTGQFVALVTIDQCTGSDTADILLNPLPLDGLTSQTDNCFDDNNPLTLDAVTAGLTSYVWIDRNGDTISTAQTAVVDSSVIKPQSYVRLITINNFNCTREDSILVRDLCAPRMTPPNAFTPNGNGPTENELFKVASKYITNYKMTIFNRWGEIIFYSEDPNEGWDGNYRGEPMPVGVYPLIITYEGEDPSNKGPHEYVGSVTLIR